MASSTYALLRSLERRKDKLEKILKGEEKPKPISVNIEEIEDLEERKRWEKESEWENITFAKNTEELKNEIDTIEVLIEKAKEIIAKVKKAVKIPLTVKIRSGWDKSSRNFLEIGYMAEQEGVDAVILHPRLKRDGFSGKARWEDISELKSRLSIPVIGNGDIKKGDDAKRMIETTNCDAVMIGRGSLGNPWIFKEVNAAITKEKIPNPPSREQKGIILLKHLYLAVKFKGELRGVREMRKHMGWYSKGLAAGSNFRKLAHQVNTFLQAKALIIDFFHLKDEDSLGWAFE